MSGTDPSYPHEEFHFQHADDDQHFLPDNLAPQLEASQLEESDNGTLGRIDPMPVTNEHSMHSLQIDPADTREPTSAPIPDAPIVVKKLRRKRKKVKVLPVPEAAAYEADDGQAGSQSLQQVNLDVPQTQLEEERPATPVATYQPEHSLHDAQLRFETSRVGAHGVTPQAYSAFQHGMHFPAMSQPLQEQVQYAQLPWDHHAQSVYNPPRTTIHESEYQLEPDKQINSDDWPGEITQAINKARRKEEQALAQYNADRESLHTRLREECRANQELEDQVQSLRNEKHGLAELVEQHKSKINGLNHKASKFKIYLTGLGTDIDGLKEEANARRESNEQIVADLEEQKSAQHALVEQSTKLKSDLLSVAREANSALQMRTLRACQLEQELNEKSCMLAEEKSARLSIQHQLLTATDMSEVVSRELKSCTDAVLDKLYEIHADVEQGGSNNLTEPLEKMVAATQGLNIQQAATVEDVSSLKEAVDSFSESLSSHLSTNRLPPESPTSLKLHLDDALKSLKTDLCRQEKMIVQTSADQKIIAHLQQQLQASNATVSEHAADLSKWQATLNSVREQYAALQAQVSTARPTPICTHQDDIQQLSSVKAELQARTDSLQELHAASVAHADEAKNLADENARLRIELEALREALHTAQTQVALGEKEVVVKVTKAVEAASRSANNFVMEKKAESENAIKQANLARDRLAEQVTSLQARLQELNSIAEVHNDIQEKHASLNARFSAQEQQLHDGVQEKNQLVQDLKSVKAQLNACEKEVLAAKQSLDQCKTDAENEVQKEQERCQKRVDSLQVHLTQTKAEMQAQVKDSLEFQQTLQQSYQQHENSQREQVTRLTNEAAEAHAECERLREKLANVQPQQLDDLETTSHESALGPTVEESRYLGAIVQESQQANYTHSRHFGRSSSHSERPDYTRQRNPPTLDSVQSPGSSYDLSSFLQQCDTSQSFSIHEDAPDTGHANAEAERHLAPRQALQETYTFKRVPPSNSSMKLVRSGSQRSQEGGYHANTPAPQSTRYMTPEPQANKSSASGISQPVSAAGHNSSPMIISNNSAGPGMAFAAPYSRGPVTDVVARASPAKRKAGSQVVEGYNSRRKNQVLEEPAEPRRVLRSLSTSQRTSHLLRDGGVQSHMPDTNAPQTRTLGNTNARPARGTNKMTKSKQMIERFNRELQK